MVIIFFIVMIFVTISFKSWAVIVVVGLLVVLAVVVDYFVDFVVIVLEVVELEQI